MELLLLDAVLSPLLGHSVAMKLERGGVINGIFNRYRARHVGKRGEKGTRVCLGAAVGQGGQQEIDFDLDDILEVTRVEGEGVVVFNTGFGSVTIATTK